MDLGVFGVVGPHQMGVAPLPRHRTLVSMWRMAPDLSESSLPPPLSSGTWGGQAMSARTPQRVGAGCNSIVKSRQLSVQVRVSIFIARTKSIA